jgi:tRNA(Arg) A34 adenosine deaminase TadA
MKIDPKFMRLAIEKAREGIERGQAPFGACIENEGAVVICAHNIVWETTDITAHAEITAIREACGQLRTIDLSGAVIYSTCEPCPMCFSACHWAGISTIVYGASIQDAARAGYRELPVSNRQMKELGKSGIRIVEGCLRDEAVALFDLWAQQVGKQTY